MTRFAVLHEGDMNDAAIEFAMKIAARAFGAPSMASFQAHEVVGSIENCQVFFSVAAERFVLWRRPVRAEISIVSAAQRRGGIGRFGLARRRSVAPGVDIAAIGKHVGNYAQRLALASASLSEETANEAANGAFVRRHGEGAAAVIDFLTAAGASQPYAPCEDGPCRALHGWGRSAKLTGDLQLLLETPVAREVLDAAMSFLGDAPFIAGSARTVRLADLLYDEEEGRPVLFSECVETHSALSWLLFVSEFAEIIGVRSAPLCIAFLDAVRETSCFFSGLERDLFIRLVLFGYLYHAVECYETFGSDKDEIMSQVRAMEDALAASRTAKSLAHCA